MNLDSVCSISSYPSVYAVLPSPGRKTASSANLACRDVASALVTMATLRTPSSLQALMHRTAISPRLAIKALRMFFNEGGFVGPMLSWKWRDSNRTGRVSTENTVEKHNRGKRESRATPSCIYQGMKPPVRSGHLHWVVPNRRGATCLVRLSTPTFGQDNQGMDSPDG